MRHACWRAWNRDVPAVAWDVLRVQRSARSCFHSWLALNSLSAALVVLFTQRHGGFVILVAYKHTHTHTHTFTCKTPYKTHAPVHHPPPPGRAPVFVHVIVCHINVYSLSLFIQWFQFIYDTPTVCLYFICEWGREGGCGPVCVVAFYKCDVGNAYFCCFCLRLSRVVESLMDRRCWCWGWNLYLRFSIFVLFRVCMSFHIY